MQKKRANPNQEIELYDSVRAKLESMSKEEFLEYVDNKVRMSRLAAGKTGSL